MADAMIRAGNGSGSVLKNVVCGSCDGFCPVAAKVEDGRVVKVTTRDHPLLKDVICMKGGFAPKSFAHPDRILHPLKRVGARGDNHWQQVSWDEAMDDIAERLMSVIDRYGPEAFAVGQSNASGLGDSGLCRRFMNHIGSPNWIQRRRLLRGQHGRGEPLRLRLVPARRHPQLQVHRAHRSRPPPP